MNVIDTALAVEKTLSVTYMSSVCFVLPKKIRDLASFFQSSIFGLSMTSYILYYVVTNNLILLITEKSGIKVYNDKKKKLKPRKIKRCVVQS